MAIDIKQSDYFEFLGVVKHTTKDANEIDQVTQGIDSIMSVIGSINSELDKWFPDSKIINGADTCKGLMSVIQALQSLTAQYGDAPLLKKLSQAVALTCDKLAKKNKGELAAVYSNLNEQITAHYGKS